jgi:hypothetical protein
MRISEALRLSADDFDAVQGMITIVEGKFPQVGDPSTSSLLCQSPSRLPRRNSLERLQYGDFLGVLVSIITDHITDHGIPIDVIPYWKK